MDPLSALGVASNVLAVVDFAWTLFTEARTIYRSSSGLSDDAIFVEQIVRDISLLNDNLADSRPISKELDSLVKKSRDLTAELLQALQAIAVKGRRSKWNSFASALRDVWGKDKIQSMTEKLQIVQMQISRHIQVSMSQELSEARNEVYSLAGLISQLECTTKQLALERKEELELVEKRLLDTLQACLSTQTTKAVSNTALFMTISHNSHRMLAATRDFIRVSAVIQGDQQFLETLYFGDIATRFVHVEDAHPKTFDWIFCKSTKTDSSLNTPKRKVKFQTWLETEHGIFWIYGKPGCGKSTLMKFLCNSPKTVDSLRVWAGHKRLIIAKFYFWHSGSTLQKSQEGLLRSILFEILRQCPDLISVASQATDSLSRLDPGEWSLELLLDVYQVIMSSNLPIRICLFIDGLDEFQEQRHTHSDLLKTLRKMNYSQDIKICLSSRPWTIFNDEFKKESDWQVKLEDLTHDDIHCYVTDKFNEHSQFRTLTAADPAYLDLVDLVVDRAEGVFLWVFLVVRTLLDGLTYHDSLSTLQRRLRAFPPDLESLFRFLINSIPEIYYTQSARIFTVALTADGPVRAMTYSFLGDLEDDPKYSLGLPTKGIQDNQIRIRLEKVRRQLDGSTRGLLEMEGSWASDEYSKHGEEDINTLLNRKVNFFHRTVRDYFLDNTSIHDEFRKRLGDENPALTACHAILAEMKTTGHSLETQLDFHIRDLFFFGSKYPQAPENQEKLELVLEEAETVSDCIATRSQWVGREGYFLGLAARNDFFYYVQRKVTHSQCIDRTEMRDISLPVLYRALHLGSVGAGQRISLRCVELLLKAGADPNTKLTKVGEVKGLARFVVGKSTWELFLAHIDPENPVIDLPILRDLMKLLLNHGADWDATIPEILPFWRAQRRSLNMTAGEMIVAIFGKQVAEELQQEIKVVDSDDRIRNKRWGHGLHRWWFQY
ncbi:hypothetical protein F4680DRAFT_405708 [Xylaria scruposa]|nr:hypothetical protein F4680DRAFT_405708 [Xylaria scruposa]